MNEAMHNQKIIENFDDRAGEKAFSSEKITYTGRGSTPGIKDVGFYEGYLDEEERFEVLKREDFQVLRRLNREGNLQALVIDQSQTAQAPVVSWETNQTTQDEVSGTKAKKAYAQMAEILGVDLPLGAIGQDLEASIAFEVEKRLEGMDAEERAALEFDIRELATKEYLTDEKDPSMLAYKKAYEDSWKESVKLALEIDDQGRPYINSEEDLEDRWTGVPGREDGIRQRDKRIYHLNVLNSSGSESGDQYVEKLNGLLTAQLGTMLPGSFNSRDQGSTALIYNMANDQAASEDVLKKIGQDFQVVGFTFDDQAVSIVIQSDLDPETKTGGENYEIRNVKEVFDFLADAGFQHKNVLMTTNNILTGLTDGSGEMTKGFQSKGQTRSKLSTTVDAGGYSGTVLKANTEMLYEGMHVQEGEFMYYDKTNQKWVHSNDPLDISFALLLDRQTQMIAPMSTVTYGGKFNDRVTVASNITAEGRDLMAKELFTLIEDASQMAEPPKLHITSSYRDRHHEKSKQNPKSAHLMGDAVDLSVKGDNGKIIEKDIEKWMEMYNANPNLEMHLEFPSVDHPEYKYYKEMYPELTTVNARSPVHLHIEYNREL